MKQENENKNENEKDDIDKYIEDIVNKKISEPEGFEKAIREALYSDKFNKKLRKRQIIRTISTACATVILTSGVAIGGFIVYEKVWKEPKQYTYEELKNTIADTEVSDEEKKDLISEEQAKQTALEIAKNLGYENEVVESIELKQNKIEEYEEKYYEIQATDNQKTIKLKIDAINGQIKAFDNTELLENNENNKELSEEEVINIANDICTKIKLEKNNYQLNKCNEEYISYRGKQRKIWSIEYYKKYNGIVNPYEKLNFDLVVNEEINVSTIYTDSNGVYEDNPQIITEQEAINIALSKEKELTSNEISKYFIEKGIRKVNNYIFNLENYSKIENNKNQLTNTQKMNENSNIVRNVWIITIKHEEENTTDVEEYLKGKNKQYYIDSTTGEIIGGKKIQNE